MEIESKKRLLENPMKMRQIKELVRVLNLSIFIHYFYLIDSYFLDFTKIS